MKLVPIVPKGFEAQMKRLPKAVEVGMRQAAEAVKADFETTTQTWEHAVTFTITGEPTALTVGTADPIWQMVDEGTKPHIIVPRRGRVLRFAVGGSPKTRPGRLTAGSGTKGGIVVIRPRVNHPGTDARNFTAIIARRWRRGVQPFIRRAIEEALH